MNALLVSLPPGENYLLEVANGEYPRIKLFAPHAGCIEPCTGPIVQALAGSRYDSYLFRGIRKKDCFRTLHVTSSHYDEPRCLALVAESDIAVAVHGCDGGEAFVEIGGSNLAERELLAALLAGEGHRVLRAEQGRGGEHPDNFINRAKKGGVQIELSAGFRRMLFPGFPRAVTRHPDNFPAFIRLVERWLRGAEERLEKSLV